MIFSFEDVHLGPQSIDAKKTKVLVCDIDGTVADLSHRRQWVATKPKNWKAFETTMHLDEPMSRVISLVQSLHNLGTQVIYCSGRGEQNRDVTQKWLDDNELPQGPLYMRKAKDYRSDDIVKRELLDEMRWDGYEPDLVLDDRDRVVAMWRDEGIETIQVAKGDF